MLTDLVPVFLARRIKAQHSRVNARNAIGFRGNVLRRSMRIGRHWSQHLDQIA